MSAKSLQAQSLQASIDRFVRTVGVKAQGEIEKAVRKAVASGKLQGHETVSATAALSSEKIGLSVTIYGKIEL
jgi:hypothetical protein